MSYYLDVEISYCEDNYEDGEVNAHYWDDLTNYHKTYKTPEDALKAFAEEYGDGKQNMVHVEGFDDGDAGFYGFSYLKKDGYYGFEDPSEADLALWKEGKKKLYAVEYQARVIEAKPVVVDESALPFKIEAA